MPGGDLGGKMWMTYDEAAHALGIKSDSVRRQARLRHWPRRTTNEGKVQVDIPEERLAENPTATEKMDSPPPPPDNEARIIRAEIRAEAAERRVEELAQDRDQWRTMAEALRADLATERSRTAWTVPGFLSRFRRR